MALDGTYDGLKASVADFLNRDDLSAQVPDFITLAETQMKRRFAAAAGANQPLPRRFIVRVEQSVAAAASTFDAPERLIGPRTFILLTDPIKELEYLSPETFVAAQKTLIFETTDKPRYYTVIGGEFQILPAAPEAYAAEIVIYQAPEALSDSVPTNWLLQAHPDIYLYGALTQAAPYLENDERLSVWGTLFTQAISDASVADPVPTDKGPRRIEDLPRDLGRRWSIC